MNATTTTTIPPRMNPILEEVLKQMQSELGERYLRHIIKLDTLTIFYRTRGNYFVKALYNEKGEWIKSHYYHNWNEIAGRPFNYLFSRPALNL